MKYHIVLFYRKDVFLLLIMCLTRIFFISGLDLQISVGKYRSYVLSGNSCIKVDPIYYLLVSCQQLTMKNKSIIIQTYKIIHFYFLICCISDVTTGSGFHISINRVLFFVFSRFSQKVKMQTGESGNTEDVVEPKNFIEKK